MRFALPIRTLFWLLLTFSIGALNSCATNPVTGQSDFVLMSEDQELELGRKYNAEVLKQMRRYEDPALSAYVQQVGEQLARNSHRAELIYRFGVIDSDDVNAFALPGGYIYITRGLLAYLNSEAELAAVLGHEIGHVTARHAVRQHSAATATGLLGAVIGAAVGVQGAGDLANLAGAALVRGYGREHELEADRLGAEYLARTGYDPEAMLEVIGVLKNQELFDAKLAKEQDREPRSYHGVFATHPSNDQRLQEVVAAARSQRTGGVARVNREGFLQNLNGMTFGDGEKDGIRRENRFYHAEFDFGLEFPRGWRLENRPDQLLGFAPTNDGVIRLVAEELNRRVSPQEFMRTRMKLSDMRNGEAINHRGMEGYTAIVDGRTPYGSGPIRYVVMYYRDRAWVFAGAAKGPQSPYRYDGEILATARSFHALTPAERDLTKAQKIQIQRVRPGTTYGELARVSPIPNHPEDQLRLLNGDYPDREPRSGDLIKIVR